MQESIKIFYSHSKVDKEYLELLKIHVSNWNDDHLISAWSDDDMLAGDEWNDKIENALVHSDIVIFLTSVTSLASKYIKEKEIPLTLTRLEKGDDIVIFPILVTDCGWEFNSLLKRFQGRPKINGELTPLDKVVKNLGQAQLNTELKNIAKEIRELAEQMLSRKIVVSEDKYRGLAEEYIWDDGKFSEPEKYDLKLEAKSFGIDEGKAKEIIDRVEQSYIAYQKIIEDYISNLKQSIIAEYPLKEKDTEILKKIKRKHGFENNPHAKQKLEEKEREIYEGFINLDTLQDMLQKHQWKSAAYLTQELMYKEAGRSTERWLRKEDIAKLTESFLPQLDRRWMEHSNGHFGFSIQKEIYLNTGGTPEYCESVWNKFNDAVGWRKNGNFLKFDQLSFSLDDRGQLPYPPHYQDSDDQHGYIASLIFNLNNLEQTLQKKQWRLAALVTMHLVLLAAGRNQGKEGYQGYLRKEDLRNFSIEILKEIDRLWVMSSKGRFGLSTQAEIYKGLNGEENWDVFVQTIGWHDNGKTDSFDKLDFSLNAPKGELPFAPACDHSDSKPYIAFLAKISWN